MRIRWRGLELPHRVLVDKDTLSETYGKFSVEPFERGFGTTIGNSLRRILLSSLEGAAVTSVKIKGATHEFTSIEGVQEDVTDIILKVKDMVVSLDGEGLRVMKLNAQGPGEVTADLIEADAAINIRNKDMVIATLNKEMDFDMEFVVEKGRGYVPASEAYETAGETEVGMIRVDATFSPVTRVRYKVEDTRVGQKTNYDKLILEIWTDGTVSPEMALVEASKILRKHTNPFVQYFEQGSDEAGPAPESPVMDEALAAKLRTPLADLGLSIRPSNCFEAYKITSVGEVVRMTESQLLSLRAFGQASLDEVKEKIAALGLQIGMELPA